MGGIGNQDLFARIALGFEIRAHQQDAGELAMRAGGGLESNGIKSGDFREASSSFAITSMAPCERLSG